MKITELDKLLAVLSIILGVFFLSQIYFGPMIKEDIIFIIAPLLYLLFRERIADYPNLISSQELTTSSATLLALNILFFTSFSFSIITLYVSEVYVRPPIYFILTALMSISVLLEIFLMREEGEHYTSLILLKIIIISLSLRWSINAVTPYIGSDTFFHWYVVNDILKEGKMIYEHIGMYTSYPAMLFLVAMTSYVSGMGVHISFLVVGFFEVISLLFIFIVGKRILNEQIGLIATLLIGINGVHVSWGTLNIPQTFGLLLTPILLYLIYKRITKPNRVFSILFITFSLLLIYSHTLSSFIFWIIIIGMFSGLLIFSVKNESTSYLRSTLPIFFGAIMLSYWIYISGFFEDIAKTIGSSLSIDGEEIALIKASAVQSDVMRELINNMGFIFFMGLAVIGTLYWFRNRNGLFYPMLFSGGLLISIVMYAGMVSRFNSIVPYRWLPFIYIILSIVAATGLFLFYTLPKSRLIKLVSVASILSMLFYSNFLFIENDRGGETRTFFLESEMATADTMHRFYGSTLVVDGNYETVLRKYARTQRLLYVYPYLFKGGSERQNTGEGIAIVIRKHILENPFNTYGEKIRSTSMSGDRTTAYTVELSEEQKGEIENLKYDLDYIKVYDNGEVIAYRNTIESALNLE